MKLVTLFFIAAMFGACGNDTEQVEDAAEQDNSEVRQAGDIPRDNFYHEIVGSGPEAYTWKEIDKYYRSMVVDLANEDYLENLQKKVINLMVTRKGLLELADSETIEYYFHEFQKPRASFPSITFKFLQRMQQDKSGQEIRELAKKALDEYVNEMSAAGQQRILEMPNIKGALDEIRLIAGIE